MRTNKKHEPKVVAYAFDELSECRLVLNQYGTRWNWPAMIVKDVAIREMWNHYKMPVDEITIEY